MVNTAAHGAIASDFNGGHVRDVAKLNGFVVTQTTLGRADLPEDIGDLIASLVSEDNRGVNGPRNEASGEMSL